VNEQEQISLNELTQDAATRVIGSVDSEDTDSEFATSVKLMERLRAEEIFSTPEESKRFLDSLTYDDFKKWISLINGLERNIPVSERGKVSSSHVQSESGLLGTEVEYRPPHMNQRDGLLQTALEKAQSIDDPEIAGLVLGMSINAIHYFEDGNGRTARMTYALLTKGYDGSYEAKQYYSSLLENTKGREIVDPNPVVSGVDKLILSEMRTKIRATSGYDEAFEGSMIPGGIFDAYPDEMAGEYSPQGLAVSDEIDARGRRALYEVLEDGSLTMTSLMVSFPPERIKEFVHTTPDGSRAYIMGSDFLPTLSQEYIEHWWRRSQGAKSGYVKRLINFPDRDDVATIAAAYAPKDELLR